MKLVTHDGTFHADEIFAIALIKKFITSNVEIERTRDKFLLESYLKDRNVFVLDVGKNYQEQEHNFDHHQKWFNIKWKDGNPLSTCGLVWKYLKKKGYLKKYSDEILENIENKVIKRIDLHDNKLKKFNISHLISSYYREEDLNNEGFFKAISFAQDHLDNVIYHELNSLKKMPIHLKDLEKYDGGNIFKSSFSIKNYKILNSIMEKTDAKVICYNDGDKWCAKSICDGKFLAPSEWRGLADEELVSITGFKGATFVHKSGFLCVAKNEKTILKMASVMIND